MKRIRAALFDMDGTIYASPVDWSEVRRRIGLERDGRPIYEQILSLPPRRREEGIRILEKAERIGSEEGWLMEGASELIEAFHRQGVRCALITNNSRRSVDALLSRYPLRFELVLARDDGAMKPDPGIFRTACERLGVRPEEAVVLGDTHYDAIAAHNSGIRDVILVAPGEWVFEHIPQGASFIVVADLIEAKERVEELLSRPDQVQSVP